MSDAKDVSAGCGSYMEFISVVTRSQSKKGETECPPNGSNPIIPKREMPSEDWCFSKASLIDAQRKDTIIRRLCEWKEKSSRPAWSEVTQWECGVCHDFHFVRRSDVRRHLIEQHSGFGWKCKGCKKIFGRRGVRNQNCIFVDGNQVVMVNRLTGITGPEAEHQMQEFLAGVDQKVVPNLLPRK
ncbi:hypothetical protein CHS0354_031367 [Potamilus streckersoni]|uniref:Uncharacterized protein n=1 Tax=Potamilus streckersoni TaxID=2493646 RepID=A0AAE0SK20_9BIVA|nr:hypothetical protein CHS0354_031367 [Potamilus streckersoni]